MQDMYLQYTLGIVHNLKGHVKRLHRMSYSKIVFGLLKNSNYQFTKVVLLKKQQGSTKWIILKHLVPTNLLNSIYYKIVGLYCLILNPAQLTFGLIQFSIHTLEKNGGVTLACMCCTGAVFMIKDSVYLHELSYLFFNTINILRNHQNIYKNDYMTTI